MTKPMRLVYGTLFGAATLALVAPPSFAGRWESIEELPRHTPVVVMVDEHPRKYFRITPSEPLSLTLEGPARLRVISRAEFAKGSSEIASYHLRALEGDTVLDEQTTESSSSTRVRLQDGHRPVGKRRRMIVDVPAGRHQLRLTVEGVGAVLVRLQQGAPARGDEKMVTLTPVDAPRSVTVTEGERTIPYYTTFVGKPVKLRVVGPTVLDLTTRLDFDATMRGTHAYRITVSERGRVIKELSYHTTKSTTAVYPRLPDRVPSKFDRSRLTFGEGLHEILVQIVQPENGAAEIHARIPEPSIGGEE